MSRIEHNRQRLFREKMEVEKHSNNMNGKDDTQRLRQLWKHVTSRKHNKNTKYIHKIRTNGLNKNLSEDKKLETNGKHIIHKLSMFNDKLVIYSNSEKPNYTTKHKVIVNVTWEDQEHGRKEKMLENSCTLNHQDCIYTKSDPKSCCDK